MTEHIKLVDELLIYYPVIPVWIKHEIYFPLLFGIVSISVYLFKLPFYWFKHPRYPAPKIIALYVGLFSLFLGIYNFLTVPIKKVVIDKSKKSISIVEEKIIKTEKKEYNFSEIKNLELQKGRETAHDYHYYLIINFKNGQAEEIGEYAENSDNYKNLNNLKEDGQKIANFARISFTNK